MKKLTRFGSPVLLMLSVQTAYGANLQFLEYSPARNFTEQDWEMLKTAADEALNERKTGESVFWSNPDSGNSGSLVITGVFEKEGAKCKTLQINSQARGTEGQATHPFCQQPDQTWKVDAAAPN